MDRRNGGDPLAPPRPPKSLPRVHRPRAPEPTIMSAPVVAASNNNNNQNQSTTANSANTTNNNNSTTTNRSLSNVPQLSPKPRNLSSSSSPVRNVSNINSSIPPPLPPAPQIVPLTPLHTRSSSNHHHHHLLPNSSNSSSSHSLVQPASTFSRRRPPAALPSISIPSILSPSLDPSASNTTTASATSPVTLAAPRPENERLTNEYVDTPFSRLSPTTNRLRPHQQQHAVGSATTTGSPTITLLSATTAATAIDGPEHHQPSGQLSVSQINSRLHSPSTNSSSNSTTVSTHHGKPAAIGSTATTTTLHSSSRNFNNNTINTRPNQLPLAATATPLSAGGSPTIQSATLPITKQPVSNTFSKDSPTPGLHELDIDLHPSNGDLLNSIFCPQCKKCRCEECQRPRPLPSRWVCGNTCFCSADSIIDYASCMCCVTALYYHLSKNRERESDTISNPCSCLPHKRTLRWGILGALSLCLPCLWCYWPMRGCGALCAKCYAKHSRHGCRCQLQNGISLAGSILGGTGLGGNGNNGSQGGGPGNGTNGTDPHLHHGGANTISSKFSAVNSTSPFGKGHHHHHSHHHHHHHHHHHSDLTPEKRLLDSSPEY